MTVRPISAVSYTNGYNKLNFEGRRRKSGDSYMDSGNSYLSGSFMKSIPVAALIAMSPLNGVQAQTSPSGSNEKILQVQTYKNPVVDGCNILFISNDGNDDDVEAIALQHGRKLSYSREIRGVKADLIKRENFKQYLDTLKMVNVTYNYTDGTPSRAEQKYVVTGPCTYDVYVDEAATGKELKHTDGKYDHKEYEIDKDLFDYLKRFMEAGSIKTEDRDVEVDLSKDYDVFRYIM